MSNNNYPSPLLWQNLHGVFKIIFLSQWAFLNYYGLNQTNCNGIYNHRAIRAWVTVKVEQQLFFLCYFNRVTRSVWRSEKPAVSPSKKICQHVKSNTYDDYHLVATVGSETMSQELSVVQTQQSSWHFPVSTIKDTVYNVWASDTVYI